MEINDFIEKVVDQFDDIDASEINANTAFQELEEWSSLTALSLIAMAKTEYGKTITGKELRECVTVEDVFNLIASK